MTFENVSKNPRMQANHHGLVSFSSLFSNSPLRPFDTEQKALDGVQNCSMEGKRMVGHMHRVLKSFSKSSLWIWDSSGMQNPHRHTPEIISKSETLAIVSLLK